MDKPLSQERLNEIEQSMELERYFVTHGIVRDMKWMISEIKRLQAIEAERDRYKEALEKIATMDEVEGYATPEMVVGREALINKGVNDHE